MAWLFRISPPELRLLRAVAVRASHRPRPQVAVRSRVRNPVAWKDSLELVLALRAERLPEPVETGPNSTLDRVGRSRVASSIKAATGFRSLAAVSSPKRADSNGKLPPSSRIEDADAADGRGEAFAVVGTQRVLERRVYPYAAAPSRSPLRVAMATRLWAATGSPCVPMACKNCSRSASSGSRDASTAALAATRGLRAHHTWRRMCAGTGVMGVRSRTLSIPSSVIGGQRSIRRRSFMVGSIERVMSGGCTWDSTIGIESVAIENRRTPSSLWSTLPCHGLRIAHSSQSNTTCPAYRVLNLDDRYRWTVVRRIDLRIQSPR